jgi:ribosomal protein S18 acetylase RimI-like enzyme
VISDAELAARQLRSLRGFYAMIASGTPDARLEQLGDVQVCVVPASRIASLPNGVVYGDTEAFVHAFPRLGGLYGDLPFLVWLRPGDARASRNCEAAGLRLDGGPQLMAATISELDLEPRAAIDRVDASWFALASVNARAYGRPVEAFTDVLAGVSDDAARVYGARLNGELASVLCVRDGGEGDLGVYMVATLPEARGRGLAGGLLRLAMREAVEDGGAVTTTSLEASALGAPVYEAIGYRTLGILEQWERRL